MKKRNEISCPQCNSNERLSLTIDVEGTLRVPAYEGKIVPAFEILANSQTFLLKPVEETTQLELFDDELPELYQTTNLLVRYSDIENATSIVLYKDEARARLYCPRCSKVFRLDKAPEYFGNEDL